MLCGGDSHTAGWYRWGNFEFRDNQWVYKRSYRNATYDQYKHILICIRVLFYTVAYHHWNCQRAHYNILAVVAALFSSHKQCHWHRIVTSNIINLITFVQTSTSVSATLVMVEHATIPSEVLPVTVQAPVMEETYVPQVRQLLLLVPVNQRILLSNRVCTSYSPVCQIYFY